MASVEVEYGPDNGIALVYGIPLRKAAHRKCGGCVRTVMYAKNALRTC